MAKKTRAQKAFDAATKKLRSTSMFARTGKFTTRKEEREATERVSGILSTQRAKLRNANGSKKKKQGKIAKRTSNINKVLGN